MRSGQSRICCVGDGVRMDKRVSKEGGKEGGEGGEGGDGLGRALIGRACVCVSVCCHHASAERALIYRPH